MNSALLSSKKMDYCTPQGFFDTPERGVSFHFRRGGHRKSAKCKNFYTPETDGPDRPVEYRGQRVLQPAVWAGHWARGCAKPMREAQAGTTVVLLIPARTDTAYFHDYIYGKQKSAFARTAALLRTRTGTRFPPAPFPSMVVLSTTEIINA